MLRPNAVRAALTAGDAVHGLFCAIPAPALVEMIGCAGYDFVILDSEHTGVDPQELENLIRAAEAVDLTPFVRVPEADPGAILRALDAGAMGVVVPHVRTAADLAAAVRAARYAPEGMRSLNGGRVPGFGRLDLGEYLARANAEIMVVAMIEDAGAVEALGEILAVPGLDLVLEGAADLSQSYGVPWQTRHPVVRRALTEIADRCDEHGVPFCAIPRTPDDHRDWAARGVRAFVLGEERGIAARALRAHREAHRLEEDP
ncbi:HpcH/HpaI aldolase family protein [Actinomycetospora aeridis]|uniref:Aldolase/citrate lyase family protein n=1 Tax=Actinomycetospora aeridis TaxID=3129231 RepID=A0ABU8N5P4_9PSEU